MIKYSTLPKNIERLLDDVETFLQSRSDILFAYLFGSLARGKPLPLSDVDIAIYLSQDKEILEKKMEILGKLMDILQTDEIDLVVLNKAPIALRMKILENNRIISDRAPFLRHRYESLTMRQYFDFSVKETAILEKRFFHD